MLSDSNFPFALLLTLIAGLSTGIGGVIVLFTKKFSTRTLSLALGFSAGVMLFISLTELFTEARTGLGAHLPRPAQVSVRTSGTGWGYCTPYSHFSQE